MGKKAQSAQTLLASENVRWDKMLTMQNVLVKNYTRVRQDISSLSWLEIKDWRFKLNIEAQPCGACRLELNSSYT